MKTEQYKLMARIGYFLLLALIPVWHLWLSPPALNLSPWLIFTIWFVPLLFPLKGILQGNPFTFAWCGFLALLYIMHAVVIIYTAYLESASVELTLAICELLFSSVFLMGNIYFAKYRGQELGLSIRKKKKK
jgi:uncharacterized membrane protein